MVRSWEARKASCTHPGDALTLNTLPRNGCLSSPLPSSTGPGPRSPGRAGAGQGWPGSVNQPPSSFLTSPVFWHMLQRVASAGSPDWGIGRCCWASYRERQTDVQNSWKEPPEPVCATTRSLVFQISLQVGTGLNVHSFHQLPPLPWDQCPHSQMLSDPLPKSPLSPSSTRFLPNVVSVSPFIPGLVPALPTLQDPHVLLAEGAGLFARWLLGESGETG